MASGVTTENVTGEPSKFRGVVALANGNWGAQLYTDHQRFWLGTFQSEMEAAMAYDSAAIKLRNGNSRRNFPWTSITRQEPIFQQHFSTEAILQMIKDGSYPTKFADYLRLHFQPRELEVGLNFSPYHWKGEFLYTHLFEKELTPSDVGKLNRLVIPKKYATSHFPCFNSDTVQENVLLDFFDKSMRSWVFRYCYWKSSQSYVFTRGWKSFVQQKKLNTRDRIIFSRCEFMDGPYLFCTIFMIEVAYHNNRRVVEETSVDLGENIFGEVEFEMENMVQNLGSEQNSNDVEMEKKGEADKDLAGDGSGGEEKKGFKLFGVQIN